MDQGAALETQVELPQVGREARGEDLQGGVGAAGLEVGEAQLQALAGDILGQDVGEAHLSQQAALHRLRPCEHRESAVQCVVGAQEVRGQELLAPNTGHILTGLGNHREVIA